jgi:hypothetical protein
MREPPEAKPRLLWVLAAVWLAGVLLVSFCPWPLWGQGAGETTRTPVPTFLSPPRPTTPVSP